MTLGALFILLTFYLFLAFISYFFSWKADQSFEWSRVFSDPSVRVENWGGKAGAWLSNLFINKWFGVASLFVPLVFLVAGLRLFGITVFRFFRTLINVIIAVILLSITLGYLFGDTGGFLGSGIGGGHGYYISEWLVALIGKTGTAFLIFISLFIFLSFGFGNVVPALKKIFWPNKTKESTEPSGESPSQNSPEKTETHTDDSGKDEGLRFTTRDLDRDDILLTIEQKRESDEITDGSFRHEDDKIYDPTLDLSHFNFPSISLLKEHKSRDSTVSEEELISNKDRIVETLANYKIQIDKIKATIGPAVTLYEIVPAPGIRISKIKNLEDDIALSLSALGIRIIAPIPGRGTIGIEVPNRRPEIVSMRSVINSKPFQDSDYELAIGLGKTVSNETYVVDLTRMPHLLVAGATGQGKSVGLNAIITSLLYKMHPAKLKFVLIDPKKVELTLYSSIENHYLAKLPDVEEPIITDTQKVIHTLKSLTVLMDERYNLLKKAQVRNIKEYNEKFVGRKLSPKNGHKFMPYIVVVIDEFADLIMTAGREIEMPLARLAQLARATGIHLIIATQRPSTNIITGAIKANFPVRIAFKVISMVDSRTILDSPGANQLVGRGDMLITSGSDMIRLQCAYIDAEEMDALTSFISNQQAYPSAYHLPEYSEETGQEYDEGDPENRDELFESAARLVVQTQIGSTSLIQRKLSIGYNRAGRIMDQLEAAGIVGPAEGSKPRAVKMADELSLEQFLEDQ